MTFNKITAIVAAASCLFAGAAALPANITGSAVNVVSRSIDPTGTHTGQSLDIHLADIQTLIPFLVEIGLGACGWTNYDYECKDNVRRLRCVSEVTDSSGCSILGVAAISHDLYDNYPGYAGGNPNNNPVCGRTATVTYAGKTITVGIVDRCEGCSTWDLDLSPSAFQQFAPLATGRLYGATWYFN
ncbi:putative effector protein [Ceratobasidium theobromae]|uniref:Putative effector protein n=1 Tax=Ceratobasidium theobromae TaxID=1582974 RepID=A0A5N5Q7F3_9AGAM|nr:putative effector protein [Ceratobasidium theobromae]